MQAEDTSQVSTEHVRTPVLDIAYEAQGDPEGQPVVLLHGFPDDIRSWDDVAESLTQAGYRTYAPYLRGFGPTRFINEDTPRTGRLAALTHDVIEFVDALDLEAFVLVGHDWGARTAQAVAALYPERVTRLVSLSDYEITWDAGATGSPSYEQLQALWYQYLFNVEEGRYVLEADRRGLCRYLWETWSPTWEFTDETFETTAASFDNPDFVEVVIDGYQRNREDAETERYAETERELRTAPQVTVPTTVLLGGDDGINLHTAASTEQTDLFTGEYSAEVIDGAGHFLHRERPDAVVGAIVE